MRPIYTMHFASYGFADAAFERIDSVSQYGFKFGIGLFSCAVTCVINAGEFIQLVSYIINQLIRSIYFKSGICEMEAGNNIIGVRADNIRETANYIYNSTVSAAGKKEGFISLSDYKILLMTEAVGNNLAFDVFIETAVSVGKKISGGYAGEKAQLIVN